MYQASEVEQFAPGHHEYPRASEADWGGSCGVYATSVLDECSEREAQARIPDPHVAVSGGI